MLLVLTMLLGCLTGLLTVSAEDAAAGPVARYTFDEENLDDSSGSNLAATAIGEGLTYTAEEGRGKVLELNNTGKRRDNGNGLRISKAVMDKMSEANAFTVVMDAKIHGIDAGSYPTWLDINAGVGKNEGNDYFLVSLLTFADTPGEFNAQLLADEYGIPRSEAVRIHNGTGSSACIGKWVQLAFLMEGSTAKIYVDGKLAGEGDFKCDVTKLFSGGAAKREMNMTLGTPSCWPDGAMDAALDNVEIYDRALTEAQLKALRPDEGGDQPAEERLPVAYYTFDNGALTDYSGNGYNAKAVGGANGDQQPSFVEAEGHGLAYELNNKGLTNVSDESNGIRLPKGVNEALKSAKGVTIMMDAYVHAANKQGGWIDISNGVGNVDKNEYVVVLMDCFNRNTVNSELKSDSLGVPSGVRISGKGFTSYAEYGKWVQLAFVQDGTNSTIYIDGKVAASGDQRATIAQILGTGANITIGRSNFWQADTGIDAMIDNVAVYDYALTQEQLKAPKVPKIEELPLVAYYDFDGVEGTNVPDKTGNGHNGTLINGATVSSDVQIGGNTLNLVNTVSGSTAQGMTIPADTFTSLDDVSIVMDVKPSSISTWMGLIAAGTNRENYLITALTGNKNEYGTIGLTTATTIGRDTSQEYRIRAPKGTTLDDGKWSRVILTMAKDGSSAMYINGTKVCASDDPTGQKLDSLAALMNQTGAQFRIGSNSIWPDPGLDGRVDNVRIYSKVLAEADFASIPWTVKEEAVDDTVEFPEFGEHGLVGDFYLVNESSFNFTEYQSTWIDSNIASTNMESTLLTRTGAQDWAGARWTGRIVAPQDGDYTFYLYCDNGVRLYIDGQLVIDWWVNQWDKEQRSQPITLKKGEAHDFKLEWFEATGGSHITLRWKNDQTLTKRVIPANAFYLPENCDVPMVTEIDTSKAQLDRGQGDVGGTLTLKGKNLGKVTKAEIVGASGSSLNPQQFLTITSTTDTEIVAELPASLKAGTFVVKLTSGTKLVLSTARFSVAAAPGESDRPEHPRPDWYRKDWQSLNGWWDFAYDAKEVGITEEWFKDSSKANYSTKINVPFPWESPLSGVQDTSYRGQVWYQREMIIPEAWVAEGKTTHLYFGAVDAKCIVYVNGVKVGSHNGGYTPFTIDVTDRVVVGSNTLTLWVEDKASYGDSSYPALVGKQGHNAPCGYTHTSGIWQSVYVESRTETYLNYAHANPKVDTKSVVYDLSVKSSAEQEVTVSYSFQSKLWNEEKGEDVPTGSSFTGSQKITLKEGENVLTLEAISIPNAKLWSDTDPQLYYGTITLTAANGTVLDSVDTYFGLRQVTTAKYDGRNYEYIYLNGKPVFLSGLLDQGFWAEGIYTAPSEEALKYDILAMKNDGFNMIRKHLKIEDPLQYYWCDKLGFFVWQDMPHATAMNATDTSNAEAAGRAIYENALRADLNRDYNHPSIIMEVLFNETWGINHTAGKAADGMTTHEWMTYLYNLCKQINPNLLVEDMSACNQDHIQPTDVNTFHMYPGTYSGVKSTVNSFATQAGPGSQKNFYSGYKNEGEPFLNSEYGGVGAFAGDKDVSLCFKYQTDVQRQYENLNGYVYTEPYDIEYERNGILTYDRRNKLFPYGEIAWGGDMSIADLNQANYVGVDGQPVREVTAGNELSVEAVAVNWSGNAYSNAVLKWRFDATDIYGNNITTNLSGEQKITYKAFTAERYTIKFNVPDQKCVGTLTVWVEQNGEKLAKNFINALVLADTNTTEYLGANSIVMRSNSGKSFAGAGSVSYEYEVPEAMDLNALEHMRIVVEASSRKVETVNFGISNSAESQTTEGSERPSDMTVTVNGVEVETVYIQDNPRDIRGTLTINNSSKDAVASGGNFGYLVNLSIPADKMEAVKGAIVRDGKITVTYSVKDDAANKNGLRIYSSTAGRYYVGPTVILNPTDLYEASAPKSGNYLVSATLADGQSLTVRGSMTASLRNGTLSFAGETVEVGEGVHTVAIRAFDTHYQVYVDGNPVQVIDLYKDGASSTAVSTTGTELVIAPETYEGSATPTYSVTVTETEDATITVKPDSAFGGKTVVIAISKIAAGKSFESITAVCGEEMLELTEVVAGQTYTFEMPNGNVTVTATFATTGHTHTLTEHPAKAPTELAEGNIAYWECSGCGKKFKDANGTEEVTDVSIPKLTPAPTPVIPVTPSEPAQLPFNPNAGSNVSKFPFADVPSDSWYYSSVKAAWENGLIDGVTANEFKPNATLTVAQTIKLAAALHQLDRTGEVSLKNGGANWYDSYVNYAVTNGIIEKDYANYTKAQMNAPVTRGEFVHIFHGAEEAYKAINTVADNAIPDVKATDKFAPEIYEFYRAGILTGSDAKGTFHSASTIKRSEAAAILLRMFEASARVSIDLP